LLPQARPDRVLCKPPRERRQWRHE
jgi:hypothetical protein